MQMLLTAEAYAALHHDDIPTELVRGKIVDVSYTMPRRGQICARVAYLLASHLEDHDIGHAVCGGTAVVTRRNPDTVRGADVAYYSYERVPKGPLPWDYLPVPPDLVFEVLSPTDRWSELHVKVAEYLRVGVRAVCVLDDDTRSIHVFYADREPQILTADDEFSLADILGDFRVKVQRFFE